MEANNSKARVQSLHRTATQIVISHADASERALVNVLMDLEDCARSTAIRHIRRVVMARDGVTVETPARGGSRPGAGRVAGSTHTRWWYAGDGGGEVRRYATKAEREARVEEFLSQRLRASDPQVLAAKREGRWR